MARHGCHAAAATQRLGYKLLAVRWAMEEAGVEPFLTRVELASSRGALAGIIASAEADGRPVLPVGLPDFLRQEMENLAFSLVSEAE